MATSGKSAKGKPKTVRKNISLREDDLERFEAACERAPGRPDFSVFVRQALEAHIESLGIAATKKP